MLHFFLDEYERENKGLILTCSASPDTTGHLKWSGCASSTDFCMLFVLLFGIQLVTSSDQAVPTSTDNV